MAAADQPKIIRAPRNWFWIHIVSLAAVFAILVFIGRGQWFFGDDWDYLVYRGFVHPTRGLFLPHNEHWSTLVVAYYRAIFSVFGARTHWPYLLGVLAVHVLIVHALWRLMLRAKVDAALATGLALVVGLYGAGSENLLWAVQISYLGSVGVGLWMLLVLRSEPRRSRVAFVCTANIVSLMFSGFSVVMVAVVGLAAIKRWSWRLAAMVTAPSAVVYVAWLKWQGNAGLQGSSSLHGGPGDIPRYVWGGVSSAIGVPLRNIRLGEALLAALLLFVLVRGGKWWKQAPEIVALAAGAPVLFAVISQGRGAIESPASPRYLYVAAVMIAPLVGLAVSPLVRASWLRSAIALAACVAITGSGLGLLRDAARIERDRELTLRGQMLAAIALSERELFVSDTPDYRWNTDLSVERLKRLSDRNELPHAVATVRDDAYARLAMQVNITPELAAPSERVELGGTVAAVPPGATLVAAADGCSDLDLHGANLEVGRDGEIAVFSVMPPGDSVIRAFVPYPGGNAGPRDFLAPRVALLVRHVLDRNAILQLPTGVNHVCGIRWQTT